MVVLLSTLTTSGEEAAGLAAHQHLIFQLAQGLGGRQWLVYDWEYREWAAAVCKFGEKYISPSMGGACPAHQLQCNKIPWPLRFWCVISGTRGTVSDPDVNTSTCVQSAGGCIGGVSAT